MVKSGHTHASCMRTQDLTGYYVQKILGCQRSQVQRSQGQGQSSQVQGQNSQGQGHKVKVSCSSEGNDSLQIHGYDTVSVIKVPSLPYELALLTL